MLIYVIPTLLVLLSQYIVTICVLSYSRFLYIYSRILKVTANNRYILNIFTVPSNNKHVLEPPPSWPGQPAQGWGGGSYQVAEIHYLKNYFIHKYYCIKSTVQYLRENYINLSINLKNYPGKYYTINLFMSTVSIVLYKFQTCDVFSILRNFYIVLLYRANTFICLMVLYCVL